jgi:hypothetical protein
VAVREQRGIGGHGCRCVGADGAVGDRREEEHGGMGGLSAGLGCREVVHLSGRLPLPRAPNE